MQVIKVADTEHAPRSCAEALSRAFGLLGKRWNGVILATLLLGPAGFAELRRAVAGISDSVLSERLTELVQAGLVRRRVASGPPISALYTLTDAGQALLPALSALTSWAEQYLADESLAPRAAGS